MAMTGGMLSRTSRYKELIGRRFHDCLEREAIRAIVPIGMFQAVAG